MSPVTVLSGSAFVRHLWIQRIELFQYNNVTAEIRPGVTYSELLEPV
jgi:hypothetical protein